MKKTTEEVLKWYKQKIEEVYGKPQINYVTLPPKIEWEEIEVPYEEIEKYQVRVDAGIKKWVYFVSVFGTILGIAALANQNSIIPGIILIIAVIGFFLIGHKAFRKTKTQYAYRKVIKNRTERKKIEVPQFKKEVISNDWSIKKMGMGALKFGVTKVNGTTVLTGIDFSKEIQKFKYPVISKEKEFIETFRELENQLQDIPFVLDSTKENFEVLVSDDEKINITLSGVEKDIMNHFINTEYIFSNRKNKEVGATLFPVNSLKNYLVKTGELFNPYNDKFLSVISDTTELNSVCDEWVNTWHNRIKVLQDSRANSIVEQVIPEFTKYGNISHYSSFNFYCPSCNSDIAEELSQRDYSVHNSKDLSPQRFSKNTRCHYLLETNAWQCPMCKKITLAPIPLHKSLDEILLPVYDNLMEENKNEREKEYSEVRKKEIHYKNEMKKEMEKMYFDNLNGILELKDEMEKMHAEIEGESEAIQFINESIIKYKKLQSDIIKGIEDSNDKLKLQIQATIQKILADVDRVKDREMGLLNRELTDISKAKRLDDERRDSVQRGILLANKEQNMILQTKFDELITTNKQGFSDVTESVHSLEQTNKEGFNQVTAGISKLEVTTRKGFEDTVKASKEIKQSVDMNNAMQAARNQAMGINTYDDNTILHPLRAIKRGVISVENTLTGKSSVEMHKRKLETLNN